MRPFALVLLACVATVLSLGSGCAALATNPTMKSYVAAAAAPAESLAADALEAQIAALPSAPEDFHAWLIGPGGLNEEEAGQVEAGTLADVQEELAAVAGYVDGGAIGRLALSAVAGEKPQVVGPREAARYLLARAQARGE